MTEPLVRAPRAIQQMPRYTLSASHAPGAMQRSLRPTPSCTPRYPTPATAHAFPCSTLNKRTAKHATVADQVSAPPALHQTVNECFPPNPPRISVRSLTGRSVGLPQSISPPCFGLRQSTLQPFSCHERNTLFRNPVQHQDGCRRRLSIRQTRRPKPARSFWCLFLKKARLFVTETLVHTTRAMRRPLHAPTFPRPAPSKARCGLRPQTNGSVNPRSTKGQRSPRTPTAPLPLRGSTKPRTNAPPRTIQNKRAGTYCARPPLSVSRFFARRCYLLSTTP